jgi:prepilin-type N-terminal cleavage/methylation domain-containing protein
MNSRKYFTLIEVVVALAILSLSLAGLLKLSISSQLRIAESFDRWQNMHRLAQAAEYLLLNSDESEFTIPQEFFPYEDVQIEASSEVIPVEDLSEELSTIEGQLPLRTLQIKLLRTDDKEVIDTLNIDRFAFSEREVASE